MGFSGQKYWSGLPFPSPGDLPNPGIKPRSPHCRQVLNHMSHQGSPLNYTLEKELYMTCTGTKIFLKHKKWVKGPEQTSCSWRKNIQLLNIKKTCKLNSNQGHTNQKTTRHCSFTYQISKYLKTAMLNAGEKHSHEISLLRINQRLSERHLSKIECKPWKHSKPLTQGLTKH